MSRDASISVQFAGDECEFALKIDQILALETRLDSGISEVLGRLSSGRWRLADIREVIRLGLIGGGATAVDARRLVDAHVVPGALAEHLLIAQAIVMAAVAGVPREPVGNGEAADDQMIFDYPPQASTEPEPS